jgi:hypothetical protein
MVMQVTIERVQSERLLKEWYAFFVENFPDPDDRESFDQLLYRAENEPSTFIFLARDADGKPLHIHMAQLTDTGAVYIPYDATRDDQRNKGVSPAVGRIIDQIVAGTHCLIDVEDERVLRAGVYADEIRTRTDELTGSGLADAEARRRAEQAVLEKIERRQSHWRRQGYVVVNDPDLPYRRPASSDDQAIQAYDSLIFRLLNRNDQKWKTLFNADKSSIGMDAYKAFYLEITRAQYGNLPEAKLEETYPAVRDFLDDWQRKFDAGMRWATVRTDPVRPNTHPRADIHVTAVGFQS